MRALHINTNRDMGGGERQVLALVAGSAAHGAHAEILCREDGALMAAADARRVVARPLRLRIAYDPFAVREIIKYLKSSVFDILHVHDGAAASVGVAAARIAGVPVIVHRRIASPLRNSFFTKLKYDPSRIARFIAVSSVVKNALVASGIPGAKIAVVHSGIDIAAMDALPRSRAGPGIRMGTIGKLAEKKGVDHIIRAFSEIIKIIPGARLQIVGDGPDAPALRALADSLGLNSNITFEGARNDGAALLANWDLFLFASELEGSPGVLREAMALRVPIVSVDAPGSVEVVGATGIVVSRGDAVAMAAAAVELLTNDRKRAAITSAARDRVVSQYSMDAMVRETLGVARGVLVNSRES
ncbi:MAG: glycosyltransferase [Planctomycetes bacterium]|nr:glycosyltransferase [Planctomycetota bacterium]